MDSIKPHEDDVFYDKFGMRQWERRHCKVTEILENFSIKRICDLGCSDGKLIRRMTRDERYELIIGVDICLNSLQSAITNSEPEPYHTIAPTERDQGLKIKLFHADLLKDCSFLKDFNIEAVSLIEVMEHVQMEEVQLIMKNIFGNISPKLVIVSTPNYEFNIWFHPNLENNWPFRHDDHKYEMTRKEFGTWALTVSQEYGYDVTFDGVGLPKSGDAQHGFCSQFAIFTKREFRVFSELDLAPQTPNLIFEIEYPIRKKKDPLTNFKDELKYSYNFMRTYSENSSLKGNWEDLTPEDFEFINIQELINFGTLATIVKRDKDTFFTFLNQLDLQAEGIELNDSKTTLRWVPPELYNQEKIDLEDEEDI